MGGWALTVAAVMIAGSVLDARAQASIVACGSVVIPAGRLARVIDGRSFTLDDGREIRLAALEVPAEPEGAATALAAILADATIELRQAAPSADRYGRILAYAYLNDGARTGKPAPRPVARDMLVRGLARVSANVGDATCAADLLSHERVARAAKLGLWGDPRYAMLSAGDLTELVAGQGRFAVVEGRVVSVRESGATIYVNFGRRWSQALTVTILKRHERIFAGAGLPPKELENRRLRVRGWVDIRNGPRIEASRPEQIEFAELK